MSAHERDLRLASRFVDGELDTDERRMFESRMTEEVELRDVVDELRALRSMFVVEAAPAPSAGFFDRVVRDVRRLPTSADLRAADQASQSDLETVCGRLLIAAALLIGVGLLVFAGLLRGADSGRLNASPDEVRAEMQRIDALILERGGEPR